MGIFQQFLGKLAINLKNNLGGYDMNGEFLQIMLWGNKILDYCISLGTFVLCFFVLVIFKKVLLTKLKVWSRKTETKIDDIVVRIVQRSIIPLLYFFAFFLSVQNLLIHEAGKKGLEIISLFILTIVAIRMFLITINFVLLPLLMGKDKSEARERSLKGIMVVLKILVWSGAIIVLLDNLGFKVSAVVAGLGIGGIAVALAAQTVLGDLFSFFSILFDRPFEVGDFIIINDYLGAVEHIGIKTTRIRSLGGEQLIFSNTDLTNSRVRNYKRMVERRVVFKIGVTYDTPYEKVSQIPSIIKASVEGVAKTRFDRAHFFSYGDFSLDVETVYYVLSPDYNVYMDIQQEINLKIMEKFQQKEIEFAYPTQTLYVNKDSK